MATLEIVSEKCWRTDCAKRPTWIIRGEDGKEITRACAADAKHALIAANKAERERAGKGQVRQ